MTDADAQAYGLPPEPHLPTSGAWTGWSAPGSYPREVRGTVTYEWMDCQLRRALAARDQKFAGS
jgi:hypothetical protein